MSSIRKVENMLTNEEIEFIFQLSEVEKAKNNIMEKKNGSVYFSIPLSSSMKKTLKEKFELDFSNKDSVPMRWIKGDIPAHKDQGTKTFNKTHLIYLNDSPGKLVVDGISYPIQQGNGYIFDEGLTHETVKTGEEPRLLMGPMSEEGFAVGGPLEITADGQTDIIYFKDLGSGSIAYKINDGTYVIIYFPISIINTNTSYTLKVLFENDILIYDYYSYFMCGSENIQFGSESLNSDGSPCTITIDNVGSYPGFIQNGTSSTNGYNKIYVYNIFVTTSGGSTLQSEGGWIGQSYFGKNATNNYIINCSSDGPIIDAGGGIIGGYAASASTGLSSMYIIGCSSSGNTGQYSGGIIGFYAGQDGGNVTCQSCWSTGSIGIDAGGIYGYYPGISEGSTYAINCYSTGIIGINGGGIFGGSAGEYAGDNYATGCYSLGFVSTDGGGIFGSSAGTGSGTCIATNCYSNGIITTSGNGIFGTTGATVFTNNCYSSNGSWSSTTANTNLTGVPSSSVIGTTWVATVTNQPYELLNMGYTPYSTTNISVSSTPSLIRTYSSTVKKGNSSTSGLISGLSYEILQNSGSNITINSTTGTLSTSSSTGVGNYTLYIRNTGSYNITSYTLTVQASSSKKKKKRPITLINNNTGLTITVYCNK